MTKLELIATLQAKYFRVESAMLQGTYDTFRRYLVKCYDKIDTALIEHQIQFFTIDEGTGSEAAYWSHGEPKPAPAVSFSRELQAYITSKITDGTIKGAFSESVDETNRKAIIKAVLDQSGTYVERRLFIYKDAGVFAFKQF